MLRFPNLSIMLEEIHIFRTSNIADRIILKYSILKEYCNFRFKKIIEHL